MTMVYCAAGVAGAAGAVAVTMAAAAAAGRYWYAKLPQRKEVADNRRRGLVSVWRVINSWDTVWFRNTKQPAQEQNRCTQYSLNGIPVTRAKICFCSFFVKFFSFFRTQATAVSTLNQAMKREPAQKKATREKYEKLRTIIWCYWTVYYGPFWN